MIVLQTPRLLFRDHDLADLDPFCDMEADAEVRRFVGGKPRSRSDAERKFRSAFLPPARDRMALWATVFKPEQRYIGYCGVYPDFGPNGPIPGEGRLGFGELSLRRVVASVEVGNAASIRVLHKLGFAQQRIEAGDRRSFEHFELLGPPLRMSDGGVA